VPGREHALLRGSLSNWSPLADQRIYVLVCGDVSLQGLALDSRLRSRTADLAAEMDSMRFTTAEGRHPDGRKCDLVPVEQRGHSAVGLLHHDRFKFLSVF
jgi:hypothetical protein